MVLRVIDVETTGDNAENDHIVEIASADLTKSLKLTNEMNELVKPPVPIPPEASAIHHIIDEDVADSRPVAEVLPLFAGADAYVAHNCRFEQDFLLRHGVISDDAPWVCTYKCAVKVWPDWSTHKLQDIRYRLPHLIAPFGRAREDIAPHRAASDVLVCAALFVELLSHATWKELVQWTYEPTIFTKFAFGKHRGERYDSVPLDYLHWILGKDFDADVKASAQHWINQRA